MVATLSRAGTGWSLADQRSYDAWGNVRLGAGTGDPSGRYCASLGHRQDDESGLVYMRARYYEPSSGRFISEDASKDGPNWFQYAAADPVAKVDRTGNVAEHLLLSGLANWEAGLAESRMAQMLGPALIATALYLAAKGTQMNGSSPSAGARAVAVMTQGYVAIAGKSPGGGLAQNVKGFYQAYTGFLEIALYIILNDFI